MTAEPAVVKPCRSRGPKDEACTKSRGHKETEAHPHTDGSATWTGGVRTTARQVIEDNRYMSEADYQTWGRL